MLKHKARLAVSAVAGAIAVILFAACDGVDRMDAKLSALFTAGFAAQRDHANNPIISANPTAIEQRHFDVYKSYRAMFEEPAGPPAEDVQRMPDRYPPNADRRQVGNIADASPPCSVRTAIGQD